MQVLEFVFSSFWIYFGCLLILVVICGTILEVVKVLKGGVK